ncbi:MAG: cupredoxin domain-containing protein [Acidimicrobiia bacterium]
MKQLRLLTLVLACSLAMVACDGESGGDTTTADDVSTTLGSPATTGATGGEASIVISGFDFNGPASISAGTTVTVTNDDAVAHTWTSEDGVFNSGTLAGGETFDFTFENPGEYAYFCSIHAEMTGSITVEG